MTQKKLPKLMIHLCPQCMTPLSGDQKNFIYTCQSCGCAIHPSCESKKITPKMIKTGLTQNQYISRSLPEGYRIPPGGSKSGKRAKKKGTKTFIDNGFEGFLK